MTLLLDKRLRVNITVLHKMLTKGKIQKVPWVSTKDQIVDGLTKKGFLSMKLLQVLGNNAL